MSKKHQILLLNYEFPPLGGGAGNATYYLLKELTKHPELQITLVTSSVDQYHEEQFSDNIKIYYLDIGKNGNIHYQSNKNILTYCWKAYKFCQKLKENNHFDLVHAWFGIPSGYIAMKLNIPYIVGLRGSDVPFYNNRFFWLDRLVFKNLSKTIWKNADLVIANSKGLKELANKSVPEQIIGVIYNGVDIEEFYPDHQKHPKFTIVSTSRLIQRKGIEYLIAGFARFAEQKDDVQLHVIGSGDLETKFQKMVQEMAIEKKVNFFGPVAHDEINKLYRHSDVFVLPSLNEGMSNSLLEAMASGLAVLATDTGGTKELVDDSNGIIIEKNSTESIYLALQKLYNNRQMLIDMKGQSRGKAEGLSWGKMAGEYIEIYNK